ncbi:MAG: M20/M25/M40 family metallo-hydrolase [Eubacteriales bacterium]|nr:M20/M25/M40 family metallo-hydrolase [Eubacteriales bacterium]
MEEERATINRERLVNSFRELVAIDSPSLKERNMADELTRRLLALGFSVREDNAGSRIGGNSGNLFATLRGGDALPPLLFCAHMDTVQPARSKRAILENDGTIHSAGDTVLGADDVSAISAILEAVQSLQEQRLLKRDIEVLFSVSEETYGTGAAVFDCSVIRSKEAYVPDYDGAHGQAVVSAPTILAFRAEITGKASHAGFAPERGVNAISAAARAVNRLKLGRVSPGLTRNIGTIHGGLLTNIVPDACVMEGEIRGEKHEKALRLLQQTQKAFQSVCDAFGAGLAFSSKCLVQAYHTPADAAVVSRYFRVCKAYGHKTEAVSTFGGSDNNILAQRGISGIVLPSAMHACHSGAEYTTVEELCRLAELLAGLMQT